MPNKYHIVSKNGKVHFSTTSLLYYGGDTNFHEPVSDKFMDLVAEHSSCHMILGELYKDPSSLANIIKKSAEFVSHTVPSPDSLYFGDRR